jgi:hypothetical protein
MEEVYMFKNLKAEEEAQLLEDSKLIEFFLL